MSLAHRETLTSTKCGTSTTRGTRTKCHAHQTRQPRSSASAGMLLSGRTRMHGGGRNVPNAQFAWKPECCGHFATTSTLCVEHAARDCRIARCAASRGLRLDIVATRAQKASAPLGDGKHEHITVYDRDHCQSDRYPSDWTRVPVLGGEYSLRPCRVKALVELIQDATRTLRVNWWRHYGLGRNERNVSSRRIMRRRRRAFNQGS